MFLGLFGYYIGGFSFEKVRGLDIPNSYTKEWAGLIGQNFNEFIRAPWIALSPLLCYFFIIIIINMIKKELEATMDTNLLGFDYKKKRTAKRTTKNEVNKAPISTDFNIIENRR
ncbi:hypothetical protein [Neobacillus soli]|nr:hypothetical protein [Neobacillus soli]